MPDDRRSVAPIVNGQVALQKNSTAIFGSGVRLP
jgi:hypothetical protein